MRDFVTSKLLELAEKDSSVVLLTGDLGFNVFEKFEEKFPQQFFNVGIGEQNMIGIAAGLALDEKKVFVYSIGNFPTLRCLEQIRNDLCYHQLNVTILAQGGGFNYGGLGMSHHATEDLSIMRAIPGMTVVAPSTKKDAASGLQQLYQSSGSGYLRLEKCPNQQWDGSDFKIGKGRTIKSGRDITLIATGGIVQEAYNAAQKLSETGIDCRVIELHTLKPLDEKIIVDAAKETGKIITIEENTVVGGLFGAVAETIATHGLSVSIRKLGMNDCFSSIVGDQQFLRRHYKMDSTAICLNVKQLLKEKH